MRVTKTQLQSIIKRAESFARLPFIVLTPKQWMQLLDERDNIVTAQQYAHGYFARDNEVGTDFSYRYFVSSGPTAVAPRARRRGSRAARS